jgi:phosphate transport system substrate-binding protein
VDTILLGWNRRAILLGVALLGVFALAACGGGDYSGLGGSVKVDGSSTVFPIAEAMAEEFQLVHRRVRVTVGVSGTGGGFKKFCRGEVDVVDASRPIKTIEIEACASNGIEFVEIPIAFDGLSVMVHPNNDWVNHLTVEELESIWMPGSEVEKWSDIRPEWPEKKITLVGSDTDSGTFDYFTQAIMGEEGASRPDFIASSDDNVLVQALSESKYALGYFGYAYYVENPERLKLVPIDPGTGPVTPTVETIGNGTYQPLSRPLFIYVNKASAAANPQVREFIEFFLDDESHILVEDVGYVALPPKVYDLVNHRFDTGLVGSMFSGGSQIGVTIEELLEESQQP